MLTLETPRTEHDGGFSLVEITVAMAVFAVVLLVFVDAVRVMTTSLMRVSAATTSATQTRAAADVLGRQLGYASAANLPVAANGNWYFEFESDAVKAGADRQCTQWRYQTSSGLLQYRTWSVVTLVSSSWTTVAKSVVNDPVTQQPFTLLASDAGFSVMRVAVNLQLRNAGVLVQSQGQYTMRNSLDAAVPTASTVCTQLGRP